MQSLPMDGESLAVLAEYGLGEARLSGCHLRRYEAGEAMVRQDEAMDALLFVRSGRAKVCINARNGRHLIICYYISDGVLGDVELLTEAQAMDTVTALSQVDCVAVPMERNREALLGCLPFVLRMGQEVSAKLKYSSRAHTVSALYTSEERLCSYLLMAERDGIVRDCRICGDFFAAADIAGLEERLRGVRCRSDALAGALNGVAWQEYFSHCDPQRMEQFFTTL